MTQRTIVVVKSNSISYTVNKHRVKVINGKITF